MTSTSALLYGANGYTGRLILEQLLARGLHPLIAGRKEWEIRPLAQQHDLKYEVIALEDTEKLIQLVRSVQLVIHAAGPFIITARPMVEACLKAGTHYIDITGEIQVFEYLKSLDAQARDKGIMLMPGTRRPSSSRLLTG